MMGKKLKNPDTARVKCSQIKSDFSIYLLLKAFLTRTRGFSFPCPPFLFPEVNAIEVSEHSAPPPQGNFGTKVHLQRRVSERQKERRGGENKRDMMEKHEEIDIMQMISI